MSFFVRRLATTSLGFSFAVASAIGCTANVEGPRQAESFEPLGPDEASDSNQSRPRLVALDEISNPESDTAAPIFDDETAVEGRYDILDVMTPVRNQGPRGVCSAFAATALLEAAYKQAGFGDIDLSEQMIVVANKVELGKSRLEAGSAHEDLLEASTRFGVVLESDLPYSSSRPYNDTTRALCNKEELSAPFCFSYADGLPEAARGVARYRIPGWQKVRNTRRAIQSFIRRNHLPVVASGLYVRPSWSGSGGVVPYPSAEQIKSATEGEYAGHGVVLVGWDDNKTFDTGRKDANGNPEIQQGFFLFKNSWGSSFGDRTLPGYGWISYRYVEELMRTAGTLPLSASAAQHDESCNNGRDDNGNGDVDCGDSACMGTRFCEVRGSTSYTVGESNPALTPTSTAGVGLISMPFAEPSEVYGLSIFIGLPLDQLRDLRVELVYGTEVTVLLSNGRIQVSGDSDDSGSTWNGRFDVSAWDGTRRNGLQLRIASNNASQPAKIAHVGYEVALRPSLSE